MMKWYSIKKYQPSYEGWYIVRWRSDCNFIGISYVVWNSKVWMDYDESDGVFKEQITHFAIPYPIEIEES